MEHGTYFTLELFMVAEMIFSHVSAVFVNMPFSEEDHILIKNLYRFKGYTA